MISNIQFWVLVSKTQILLQLADAIHPIVHLKISSKVLIGMKLFQPRWPSHVTLGKKHVSNIHVRNGSKKQQLCNDPYTVLCTAVAIEVLLYNIYNKYPPLCLG